MRWVKDGPDIPPELVRAVEEGRLVFFCGAGVSQQAGLPSFKGLVEAVYEKLQRQRELYPLEQKAFDERNYDQVFANLERAIGNPALVRGKVAEALHLRESADTGTHDALLKLSTDARGVCRLVTTNYDLAFSLVSGLSTRTDSAPRLPIPKPARWNSIVHLHGFLQDCGAGGEELVLSSADFGAAYLVDGWATRFLRELFRYFTVLFVGYRADDLVVRYMLQALAVSMAGADNKPGVFAFAEVEDDEKLTKLNWQAKGIEPILYRKKDDSHEVLHQTLRVWAERASRGLLGRKSVVAEYIHCPAPPEQDEIVDQMVWALNDGTGATARFLADQQESPSPCYWLKVLDQNNLFSLDAVPLVSHGRSSSLYGRIHPVTDGLAQWLCRHLAEADVLDWALSKGGCLSPTFGLHITYALSGSPDDIRDEMKKAWSFLASPANGAASGWRSPPFAIGRQIEAGAWDLSLKREIAIMLEPLFALRRDKFQDILRKARQTVSDGYPLEVEVTFAGGDEVAFVLKSICRRPDRDSILSSLLDHCTGHLRRAMEVQEYFGKASSDHDWTYIWLPSIRPFSGSQGKPLVDLITLVAGCLDAASRVDPALARSQVDYWRAIDYPVFRRLVCYGLALPSLFSVGEAFEYILSAGSPLWRYGCHGELYQLLARLWPSLDEGQSRILVQQILAGPPAEFYREGLSEAQIQEGADSVIAERLAALKGSDRPLPDEAERFLSRLGLKRARAGVESPEAEESLGEPSIEEVASSLADGVGDDGLRRQWSSMVSDRCEQSLAVLRDLAASGKWPKDAWGVVLDKAGLWAINEPSRSADLASMLEILRLAPAEFIADFIGSLSHLLEFFPRVADDLEGNESYWAVWDKAISIALSEPTGEAKEIGRAHV